MHHFTVKVFLLEFLNIVNQFSFLHFVSGSVKVQLAFSFCCHSTGCGTGEGGCQGPHSWLGALVDLMSHMF